MEQYLKLLKEIKEKGTYKPAARPGMPGTQSLFGYQFRHDLSKGFPLLTTKKIYWKGVVTELLWFLRGDTNIKYLIDNGVNIWNEDAYNYYCKIAKVNGGTDLNDILQPVSTKEPGTRNPAIENIDGYSMFLFEEFIEKIKNTPKEKLPQYKDYKLGDCGYQYGKVWRKWDFIDFKTDPKQNGDSYHYSVDQIMNVINSLKKNPESRRHIVTAINPVKENDLALYWCHAMFQFNCRPLTLEEKIKWVMDGKTKDPIELENVAITEAAHDPNQTPQYYLDCQLYQRSADVVLGVPFNIASYALLTELIAKICNMIPGEFIHTFGDVHIYDNHKDAVEEQLKRIPTDLPKIEVLGRHKDYGTHPDHFEKYLVNRIGLEDFLESLTYHDFRLINYNPQEAIKAKLSTGLK